MVRKTLKKSTRQSSIKLFFVSVFLIVFIGMPYKAYAFSLASLFSAAGSSLLETLGVGYLFSAITTLEIYLLKTASSIIVYLLSPEFNQGLFYNYPLVQIGWKVILGLTNMFFIIILVGIAFSIILNIETFGLKKLLPKLILVALLINFSLVISVAVIDAGQIALITFGKPTIDQEKGGRELAAVFIEAVRGQDLFGGGQKLRLSLTAAQWTVSRSSSLSSKFLQMILFFILAFAFILIAGLMIARIVALWFLLILAPIAWFCSILPGTKSLFSKWMHQFLTWNFLGAAVAFFLYLSAVLMVALNAVGNKFNDPDAISGVTAESGTYLAQFFESGLPFLRYVLVMVFLYAGIYIAKTTSAAGARLVVNAVDGGRAWIVGKAKSYTIRGAKKVATETGKGVRRGLAPRLQRWQDRLAGSPGLIEQQLSRIPRRFLEDTRKEIESQISLLKSWTSDNLNSEYKITPNSTRQTAIMSILAERGELDKLTEEEIARGLVIAQRFGKKSDILKARPDLALTIKQETETDEQAIDKQIAKIKPPDVHKIQVESFTKNTTTARIIADAALKGSDAKFTPEHLAQIAKTNRKVMDEMQKHINRLYSAGELNERIIRYLKKSAAQEVGWELPEQHVVRP